MEKIILVVSIIVYGCGNPRPVQVTEEVIPSKKEVVLTKEEKFTQAADRFLKENKIETEIFYVDKLFDSLKTEIPNAKYGTVLSYRLKSDKLCVLRAFSVVCDSNFKIVDAEIIIPEYKELTDAEKNIMQTHYKLEKGLKAKASKK